MVPTSYSEKLSPELLLLILAIPLWSSLLPWQLRPLSPGGSYSRAIEKALWAYGAATTLYRGLVDWGSSSAPAQRTYTPAQVR